MTIARFLTAALLLLLLIPVTSPAQDSATETAGAGFIYATVTWPSGESKTGYLRWKDEEAYWDDLFHCGYRDLVWSEYVDLDELRKERRAEYYRTHGLFNRLMYALEEDKEDPVGWRMFLSRFGDLQSIEIHDGADDFAVTADGARHEIGGYANDAGSRLYLYVEGEEREQISWNDLSEIRFMPAPVGSKPYAQRLYGTVETSQGSYEGFIQWDKSECTTIDILDGEQDKREIDVPMGEIRSITRASGKSVEVVTTDGTTYELTGSNDVDSGNRGVMVAVADLGWVTVPWNRFRRVDFLAGHGSGPPRGTFAGADPLRGAVKDETGRTVSGRLVFDLDEAFRWDIFNGKDKAGFEYNIPFDKLLRIEPGEGGVCRVTLRNGTVLVLGEGQDTGEENGGMLVFATPGADPEHLTWSRVQEVEFWW